MEQGMGCQSLLPLSVPPRPPPGSRARGWGEACTALASIKVHHQRRGEAMKYTHSRKQTTTMKQTRSRTIMKKNVIICNMPCCSYRCLASAYSNWHRYGQYKPFFDLFCGQCGGCFSSLPRLRVRGEEEGPRAEERRYKRKPCPPLPCNNPHTRYYLPFFSFFFLPLLLYQKSLPPPLPWKP